jgi:hypothetical protein
MDIPSSLCEQYLTTKPLVSFTNSATCSIASTSFGSFANCSTSATYWSMDSISSTNFNRNSLRFDWSSRIYNGMSRANQHEFRAAYLVYHLEGGEDRLCDGMNLIKPECKTLLMPIATKESPLKPLDQSRASSPAPFRTSLDGQVVIYSAS